MKKVILTERSNESTLNIDISTTLEIVEMINNEDKKVAFAVEEQKENIAKAVDLIVDKLFNGGCLLYFGAGTSGRLGVLDASECHPTFGVSSDLIRGYIAGGDKALRDAIEGAEDNYEQGKIDLLNSNATDKDVVVGISASGNPRWLLGVLEEARAENISTIGVTSNPEAKLNNLSDIVICTLVGQEAITGSSRMKSGTAQKLVLNTLTTAVMIKLGKTYQNYMIDVLPTNDKLKDRATRIVMKIAHVDENDAKNALINSNYEVKTAIVTLILNCTPDIARIKLKENNNILRKVIQEN